MLIKVTICDDSNKSLLHSNNRQEMSGVSATPDGITVMKMGQHMSIIEDLQCGFGYKVFNSV